MLASSNFVRSLAILLLLSIQPDLYAQGTRLLRQPAISTSSIAFAYGGDIWLSAKDGGDARRITSTAAVEGNPRPLHNLS